MNTCFSHLPLSPSSVVAPAPSARISAPHRAAVFLLTGIVLALGAGLPRANALETVIANYEDYSLYLVDLATGDRTVLSSQTVGTGPDMESPVSLARAANGDLYVGGESEILKVDPTTGNRSAIPNPGSVTYEGVYGMAFASSGKLIAGSWGDQAIYSIDVATGVRTTLASPAVGSGAEVGYPGGLLIDSDGTIVYTDFGEDKPWRLLRLDPATLVRTIISSAAAPEVGTGNVEGSSGGVVKLADHSFAVGNYNWDNPSTSFITRVDPSTGNRTTLTGTAVGTGDPMVGVYSLSLGADGSLYASSSFTNTIFKVDPATGNRTVVSQVGTAGTGPDFSFPLGILPTAVASITEPDGTIPAIEAATFSGTVGVPFAFFIRASDSPTSYGATGLPAGLTLNPATGWITGTPTQGGSFVATLSATNSAGTGSAPMYLTIAAAPQTITFGVLASKLATDDAFTLAASTSSGLPVTFTVVSGPALLQGNTLHLTGAPGTVVVRASQAGNASYTAATNVVRQFVVNAVGPQIFFGNFVVRLSALPTGPRALSQQGSPQVAVSLAADGKSGTIVGLLSPTQVFVLDFTPADDGSFSGTAQVYSGPDGVADAFTTILSVKSREGALVTSSLTITGTVADGTISGRIVEKSLTFEAGVQPQTGPTAAQAGYYVASSTNTASGSTYVIADANGQAFVATVAPTLVGGGSAIVTAAGAVTGTISSGAFSGNINAGSTILTGSLVTQGSGTIDYAGLKGSTLRTDRLVNLSSRAQSGPGEKVLITGFVLGGSTPKRVLLRGVGPALANQGVASPLPNPQLKLYSSAGALVATNDDWSDAAVSAAATLTGAFALPVGGKDAAIVTTLSPGAYSMHVSDVNGATGVALAEIYDASENPSADYQRLINISSRGQVGSGENVLFGGFVVTGNSPKRVLIRGVGPGLTALGVAGALSDPLVQVYQRGTVVAKNDNWGTPVTVGSAQTAADAAAITEASAVTGAFALTTDSKDSALIVTLAPGAYSASVSGIAGATGVALVEVYEIP